MFAGPEHENAYKLIQEHKFDEAIKILEKLLITHPKDANIYGDLAVAHLHCKRKEKSFESFDKAIDLQPEYSFRYAARAYAQEYFGDLEKAIKDYEKAVKLDPEDEIALNNLGLLYEKKGYHDVAKQKFEQADKLRKAEDSLLDVIENLENDQIATKSNDNIKNKKDSLPVEEPVPIDPMVKRDKSASGFKEFKKIFTSKSQFNEFIQFIKNGFKIRK